ncbi:ImuA family protein [Sphingomicrobium arenosum]|uniref:ImuA family protein n=1 Tax=Sphingomicrobium arenosum TaxID=2233861 RepID=UPI002240ED43|nr:recA-like protein [Sphingomicrobium arenosum]
MADGLSIRAGELPVALPDGAARGLVRPPSDLPEGEGEERGGAPDDLLGRARIPLPHQPTLSEIFPTHARDAGWVRFLLAQASPDRPLLWVQERMAILEAGRIHPPGLGDGTLPLVHVCTPDTPKLLWVMEEALRCSALSGVVGEAWGEHARLDFTATRRLAFAAEAHGVPCWLVRLGAGAANLSGARWRWRVESRPSGAHPYNLKAPGRSRLSLDLFRARGRAPGQWEWIDEEGASKDARHLVAAPVDRALAENREPAWRHAS